MRNLLALTFLTANCVMAAGIFTDTWFNRGSQFNNPASLGPNGSANIHYAIVTSPPQIGNLVGGVNWSSSSNTTYTSFGADLRIATGAPSILNFQVNPGAPLDPAFDGRISTGFTDTWTIIPEDPADVGARGTVRLTFQLTGNSSFTGFSSNGSVRLNGTAGTIDTVSTGVNGAGTYLLDLPIFLGTPQPVSIFLELRGHTGSFNQIVDLDYANTAVLSGVSLTVDGDTAPSGFSLNTEAGTPEFNALITGSSAVPEPASVAFSALGFAAMVVLRKLMIRL